ncbi:TPA: type II toxin-antitoxin system PemK/MazF family toxin [Candidatus Poribacteria bacterium]|nr:type II toxin-antitoxin system PemK/MazF family toxin [Candidatus Poribacteria bacterium]
MQHQFWFPHEQEGLRPAIIVQNNLYCELSTLWVIPTSTRAKHDVDFRVPVTILGRRTYALIEQLTTVDKQRRVKPDNYLCHLSEDEIEPIDEMMRIFGGLDSNYGFRV